MEFFTSKPIGLFFYHSVCTFLTLPFQEGAYYIWSRGVKVSQQIANLPRVCALSAFESRRLRHVFVA